MHVVARKRRNRELSAVEAGTLETLACSGQEYEEHRAFEDHHGLKEDKYKELLPLVATYQKIIFFLVDCVPYSHYLGSEGKFLTVDYNCQE